MPFSDLILVRVVAIFNVIFAVSLSHGSLKCTLEHLGFPRTLSGDLQGQNDPHNTSETVFAFFILVHACL